LNFLLLFYSLIFFLSFLFFSIRSIQIWYSLLHFLKLSLQILNLLRLPNSLFKFALSNIWHTHRPVQVRKRLFKVKSLLFSRSYEDLWNLDALLTVEDEEWLVVALVRNCYTLLLIIEIVERELNAFFEGGNFVLDELLEVIICARDEGKSLDVILVLEFDETLNVELLYHGFF